MLEIKKNDAVVVVAGKDKGKRGKVLSLLREKGRVLVEGINKIKKHAKPSKSFPEGGIIEKEGSLSISNVMLVCQHCDKGVRYRSTMTEDGRKVRTCVRCGNVL